MVADVAGVSLADALILPMVPQLALLPEGVNLGCAPDEVVLTNHVVAMSNLIGQLAAIKAMGVIVEVPTMRRLSSALANQSEEDVEDALSDLVRAALESGADAIALRTSDADGDARITAKSVSPLSDFYGAQTIGVDDANTWISNGVCEIGLLGPEDDWPELVRGIVVTTGDLTEWGTPDSIRAIHNKRGRPGT
jgi:hypothetical protein